MAAQTTQTNLWFLDSLATIRVSHDEAPGAVSAIELSLPHGAMPPLHVQDEEERVYVLDGRATFYVGGNVRHVRTGDSVVIPAGIAHTYRVDSARGARWLVLTVTGRFERFVRAVSRPAEADERPPANGPLTLPEAVAVTKAAAQNGIEILAPSGTLPAEPDDDAPSVARALALAAA